MYTQVLRITEFSCAVAAHKKEQQQQQQEFED
jgi:hypothetical protein